MVEKRSPRLLQRETVYRWFSELPSPQRVEFLCGLLDLCIPLELRFLGACLEDLARKDYHSLRDSEIKANNPADLGSLTNLTDEVVRSKLLVSLALLGSSHREAAGVLFRTLTHIDSVIHNYGLQLNEGQTGDEFLLLFTMAANHPAFSFHQKQVLRQELTKIQNIMASTSKSPPGMPPSAAATTSHMAPCPGCHKVTSRSETPVHGVGNSLENALHTSAHSMEESLPKRPSGKHSKVSVEKVELKGISPKRNDRTTTVEYAFEVSWSDSSVTSVTKSCVEVTEFISKLGQLYPEENLEKTIPCLAGPDPFYLERNHLDLEPDLRYLASFPPHIWKNDHVRKFFSTSSHLQLFQNSSPANTSLYKVGPSLAASGRPVCGVAGIPSSQNNPQHRSPPSATSTVLLSHCAHPGMAGPALSCRSQLENSLPVLLATASQTPQAQEQNGILEWLRKLRLHKYYPVFKQLTMEKFLSLTEEDLNKFESLTMGAKKKLKTQLELEKEKSEKRTVNPADSSSSSSSSVSTGVARVPPTTHVAPIQSIRSSHAADLRVEVDPPPPPDPPQEGSSSEYSGPASSSSSSSSSPMGIQTPREESSDSAEESERRLEAPLGSPEKEKPVPVLSHFSPASARPTAQVLPSVQNEASSGPPAHPPPVPVQLVTAAAGSPHITPMRILNAMHKSERGTPELRLLPSSSSSSSSVQSLLTLEEKAKYSPLGGPSRSSLKMEKSFGGPVPEGPILASHQTTPNHHHPPPAAAAAAPAAVVNFGPRAKMVHPSTLDRMAKGQAQPGGMVEPSPVATSSALFHVARPPIKLLVSSPLPTEAALGGPSASSNSMQFSLPPALISPRTALYSANTKVAFSALSGSSGSGGGSLPVGSPLPGGGGGFCVNGNAASPTTTTSTPPFANLNHGPQPCPAPSQSPPSLSPTTENGFYPSGTSSSSQNHHHHHHHHHHPQQPPGCLVCSSCGCSGNCGSGGVTVGYGNYFQPTFSGPSVLTFPFLPFSPLCGGNSYLNTQQYNGGNGGGAFPMVHAPYGQSAAMAADSLLSGQSAFGVPPLQSFLAGTAGVYQASAMLGGAGSGGGGGHKKNGNLSCYNCGASGHRAQDCKQPPMDFNRQGTFRLKYAPPAESLDSTD